MLSPNVKIVEKDLSLSVGAAGNATACFGGEFIKGEAGKAILVTSPAELESLFGKPTNANANDWFQAYMYLQEANKLYISRAVSTNGVYSESGNTVTVSNEIGKVEVLKIPSKIQIGSVVKFDMDAEDTYTVIGIETDVTIAQKMVQELTINTASDGDYIVNVTDSDGIITQISYTADVTNGDTVNTIAAELGNLLENYDTSATNIAVVDNVIEISASIPGVPMNNVVFQGDMTIETTQENVEGDSYELVFDDTTDFSEMLLDGKEVLVRDSAINAIATAPIEGATAKTAAELKPEAILITNSDEYEVQEMSIPVTGNTKLKFIAKSTGSEMNGVEIAIAREADFASGTQSVFNGINLNSLFERKPSEAKKEIAVITRKDGIISGSYIVSLIPGTKDYRSKSTYIEDVINTYDELVYVKDNDSAVEMPDSRLYTAAVLDLQGNVITEAVNKVLIMSNGTDGTLTTADFIDAYGSVPDSTIFGAKDMLDVDVIIANERARTVAGKLAKDRADQNYGSVAA